MPTTAELLQQVEINLIHAADNAATLCASLVDDESTNEEEAKWIAKSFAHMIGYAKHQLTWHLDSLAKKGEPCLTDAPSAESADAGQSAEPLPTPAE